MGILKQVKPAGSSLAGNGADPYASYPDNPGLHGDEFAGYSLNERL